MPQPEQRPHTIDYKAILSAYDRAWQRWNEAPTPRTESVLQVGTELLIRELMQSGCSELGRMVETPGAMDAMTEAGHIPAEFLLRHKRGDWGDLPPEDVRENDWSLKHGSRLFSAYETRRHDRLWVITEWDRSVTTLLLPEEYCSLSRRVDSLSNQPDDCSLLVSPGSTRDTG